MRQALKPRPTALFNMAAVQINCFRKVKRISRRRAQVISSQLAKITFFDLTVPQNSYTESRKVFTHHTTFCYVFARR